MRILKAALFLVSLLYGPTSAQAQERFALLIGNKDYSSRIGRLQNPINDVGLVRRSHKNWV